MGLTNCQFTFQVRLPLSIQGLITTCQVLTPKIKREYRLMKETNMIRSMAMAIALLSGCATVQQVDLPTATTVHIFEPAPGSLPLVLYDVPVGTEKSVILEVPDLPGRVTEAELTLTIEDMDQVSEGQIYVNGQGPLEPPAGLLSPSSTLTADLEVNPKWIKRGPNEIRFVFADNLYLTTKGFTVEELTLSLTFP